MLKIGVKLSGWLSGGVKFMSYGGGVVLAAWWCGYAWWLVVMAVRLCVMGMCGGVKICVVGCGWLSGWVLMIIRG